MKYPMEDTVLSELWFLIKSRWIDRLFNAKGEEKKRRLLQNAWKDMSYYGELGKSLEPISVRSFPKSQKKLTKMTNQKMKIELKVDDTYPVTTGQIISDLNESHSQIAAGEGMPMKEALIDLGKKHGFMETLINLSESK